MHAIIFGYMVAAKLAIHSIKILPLYGMAGMFEDFDQAVSFVKEQPATGMNSKIPLVRMEVTVRYKDGTYIEGGFPNKVRALEFLKNKKQGIL